MIHAPIPVPEQIVIRRERDASLVNRITNDPAVLPFIARHGNLIDWGSAVRGCCILSNGSDAVAVFGQETERAWLMTTIFAPTCRGRRALETGKAMRDWMIPRYADFIFGPVPNTFRHAIWFYRQMGAKMLQAFDLGDHIYTAKPGETLLVLGAA